MVKCTLDSNSSHGESTQAESCYLVAAMTLHRTPGVHHREELGDWDVDLADITVAQGSRSPPVQVLVLRHSLR